MAGFANIAEYVNAIESGQTWFSQFRKTAASATTVTSSYLDYSYFAGLPLANFYASTPLESAYVDQSRGIYIPPSVSPAQQYIRSITLMANEANVSTAVAQRQAVTLCDYLMYYPFIDTDAAGEEQTMTQAVDLPRYSGGYVMAISQSASSTIGQFTMTYTNQDGVGGRVTPNMFTQIVAGGGQSLLAHISGGGFNPFIPLQAGDSGVRSIESVTFTVAGGGLMALVIVKPLDTLFAAQECRRTTSGNLESYGSAVEQQSILHRSGASEVKDGAVLGFISKANAGSIANAALVGYLETVWN